MGWVGIGSLVLLGVLGGGSTHLPCVTKPQLHTAWLHTSDLAGVLMYSVVAAWRLSQMPDGWCRGEQTSEPLRAGALVKTHHLLVGHPDSDG